MLARSYETTPESITRMVQESQMTPLETTLEFLSNPLVFGSLALIVSAVGVGVFVFRREDSH